MNVNIARKKLKRLLIETPMVLDVVSMINFVPLQTGPFEYIAVNVTDSIQFIIHAGLFGTVHSSLGTGVHIFMYMILINT